MRVAINGFGRIGRTVLRQLLAAGVTVDLINDVAGLESCAYLFKYDSVYGPYPGDVQAKTDLVVDGHRIRFTESPDLDVDLTGVDILLECTGKAKTRAFAERGLSAGAKAVLISGPSEAADITAVLGVNELDIGSARIVSNSSCTTNAIAPLLSSLPTFEHAHITTIHCYTGSQPMTDAPRGSLARSRAGAVSMIPTTTSAAEEITRLLPDIAGRLSVTAVRVPCISVSAVDAVLTFEDGPPDLDALFCDHPVIGMTNDPVVSTDLRARPESLILARPETRVSGRQMRMLGWYDNEWGFSARMLDMARRMHARI